ncbi:MAG: class I SAM-dependent methyltransferase [Solirubrobacterales bacterium]
MGQRDGAPLRVGPLRRGNRGLRRPHLGLLEGAGRRAGDPAAYEYLPSSVRRFPAPPELAARMAGAGLVDVGWVITAGGIIAIHHGTRPEGR